MWRKAAGGLAAAALTAIGVLHMIWAFSPWPFDSMTEAATYLLGERGDMPPAPLTFVFGAGVAGSSYLVIASARVLPEIGPAWIYRLGTWGLAAALLARGLGGQLLNSGATEEFATWNWRLYSPLCVTLAVLVGAATVRRHGDGTAAR